MRKRQEKRRKTCGRSVRRLKLERLEARRVLTTVSWDGGGDGSSWSDVANWDAGGIDQLPSNGDDVVIDLPGADPTVIYSGGSLTLNSLVSNEDLTLTGGTLTLTGAAQINGHLAVSSASLIASGVAASVQAASSSLTAAKLRAFSGATIVLPATSYVGSSGTNGNVEANGSGSLVDLSGMTTMSGGGFIRTLYVEATNGGTVDLSSLTEVTGGATHMLASGADSLIDLSALTSYIDTNGNRSSLISATSGGQIDAPVLSVLSAVNVTLDATSILPTTQFSSLTSGAVTINGASADMSGLTDISNSSFTLNAGGTIDLSHATAANGTSFFVNGGVTLSLPAVTAYGGQSNSNTTFRVNGSGSRLEFPGLATMTGGSFISTHIIDAEAGGVIDLSGVTAIPGGATNVTAEGLGSQVDFSGLLSFSDDNGNRNSVLTPTDGGEITSPLLTMLNNVDANLNGTGSLATTQINSWQGGSITIATAAVDLSGVTNFTNSKLTLNAGGTVNLDNAADINGASFIVNDGVTLALPSATSFAGSSDINSTFARTAREVRWI